MGYPLGIGSQLLMVVRVGQQTAMSPQVLGPSPSPGQRRLELRPGSWVEVLTASEILGTLDADQSLDGLPFMPEMLAFCGHRYRVALRAERTCVHPPEIPFRRLEGSVVLEGLRCDGSLHGGCRLGCMFFWKEAWLREVPRGQFAQTKVESERRPRLRATSVTDPGVYFCQATALRRATAPGEPIWKPGQYLQFLKSRTFTVPELVAMFFRLGGRRLGWLFRSIVARRSGVEPSVASPLGLKPGEWVEVKSRGEILQTLNPQRTHKGLPISGDMYEQCGRRFRVRERVDRVVQEGTGRLLRVHDTVTLEGSVCDRYFGCARGMPFLWREAWLKRVEQGPATGTPLGGEPLHESEP